MTVHDYIKQTFFLDLAPLSSCPVCKGTGDVGVQIAEGEGDLEKCENCEGMGKINDPTIKGGYYGR